jgi:hypothetical protein
LIRANAVYNFSLERVQEAKDRYFNYGPTARICLEYNTKDINDFKDQRSAAIKTSNAVELLDRVTRNALLLSMPSGKIGSPVVALGARDSHKLCLIKRPRIEEVSRQEFEVLPMSRSIIKRLLLAASAHEETKTLALFHRLSNQTESERMSCYVFESHVLQQYRKHIKIDARRMKKKIGPVQTSVDERVARGDTACCDLQVDFTPAQTVEYAEGESMIEENVYYLPISQCQVGIDAFFVRGDTLYLLQYTVSSRDDINPSLATFLEELKLPQSVSNRRFIFIIPDHVKAFGCPPPFDELEVYAASILIPPDESPPGKYRMWISRRGGDSPIEAMEPMELRTCDLYINL